MATYRTMRRGMAEGKPGPDTSREPGASQGGAAIAAPAEYVALATSRLYSEPSKESAQIQVLEKGETARLLGTSGDGRWLFVSVADGEKGYVLAELLARRKER